MKIQFTKMHGTGNDFIVIDGRRSKIANLKKAAKDLCNRRFGIGADQLLVIEKSRKADVFMRVYNADGSEVGMCGNGIRCLTKYINDEKTIKKELSIETPSGIQKAHMVGKNKVTVDMGKPLLKGNDIPVKLSGRVINRPVRIDGKEIRATCVSMGNPHCVLFVDDPKTYPVEKMGPIIEKSHLFPKKTNVEFVQVLSSDEIFMRVWERGAGETLACGSGACAAVVASALNTQTGRRVKVNLLGGVLDIEWSRVDDHVYMTAAAETVYKGEIEI
jgi:diaminopimelate epimerase